MSLSARRRERRPRPARGGRKRRGRGGARGIGRRTHPAQEGEGLKLAPEDRMGGARPGAGRREPTPHSPLPSKPSRDARQIFARSGTPSAGRALSVAERGVTPRPRILRHRCPRPAPRTRGRGAGIGDGGRGGRGPRAIGRWAAGTDTPHSPPRSPGSQVRTWDNFSRAVVWDTLCRTSPFCRRERRDAPHCPAREFVRIPAPDPRPAPARPWRRVRFRKQEDHLSL